MFTELLPGNALIKSVTLLTEMNISGSIYNEYSHLVEGFIVLYVGHIVNII
jgi:hypothetical protein